jgi:prolyl oligopeptidase
MNKLPAIPAVLFALAIPAPVLADAAPAPAVASVVTDSYHGVTVEDPYRWLEDGNSPMVKAWTEQQNNRARAYLDSLPVRQKIHDRLMEQTRATSASFTQLHPAAGRIFALYRQPQKQQSMIAVLGADANPAGMRVIVDPNAIDRSGATAIDWFVPSPDGRLVAVSLSKHGSEEGTLHVFNVATGKPAGETIPRVQYPTAGGNVVWRHDSQGFWYTRYPGAERPADEQRFFQKLYFHRLGQPAARDPLVLGDGLPKVAEIFASAGRGNLAVLVAVANGDGGEFEHFAIDRHNRVHRLTTYADQVVAATAGPDGALYLISRKDAPRGKLLKLKPGELDLAKARVIVPESDGALQSTGEFGGAQLVVTRRKVYLRELVGGPSRVSMFSHDGRPLGQLPLPDVASVEELVSLGDGRLLYSVETYLQPSRFRRFDERTGKATDTAIVQTASINFDDVTVERQMVTSADGTRVPINIVRRTASTRSPDTPALLTGYGGYGVSLKPRFLSPRTRLWLDAGGIFVIANLRGGGEFGESWHLQGALTRKQNVFDDFIAAARYLIDNGYTSTPRLAITGGSNGGLLMGAVLTQQPRLFGAVVAEVGLFDMLRSELEPNGEFNVTEFGSVRDPAQFKALYAYSPYHHVRPDAPYPPVLLLTGAHDGRVDPLQSRKMAARLQEAVPRQTVLLAVDAKSGHGIGSSLASRIAQQADMYAFLFDRLGLTFPEP